MSLIFIGPKRVYVVLLFWQSVANPYCALWRPLAQVDRALGDVLPGEDEGACRSACHLVMAVRWGRIVWKRLIGLSLLVFDAQT
jgi:hypothetical protein